MHLEPPGISPSSATDAAARVGRCGCGSPASRAWAPPSLSPGAAAPRPEVPSGEAPIGADLPRGLLDIPFAQDRARVRRFDAGLLLDLHLRRLARLSGAIDRAVALRLRRLRASRGYIRLGFALFRDYVRERLGVAERTGQELARLGAGLERLPDVDAALAAGKITWTAAAEVARVAGVEDAAEWVDRAQRLSVRELRARVQDELKRDDEVESSRTESDLQTDATGPGEIHAEASASAEPDDPLVRLALEACSGAAHLWEASLDLCELVAGSEVGPGERAELILADFLSGTRELPGDHEPCWPRNAPVIFGRWGRGRDGGAARSRKPSAELGPAALPDSFAWELKQIEDIVRAPVPRDPFEIDDSMRLLVARRRGLDLDLARLLRNFHSLRLAQHLGFAGFQEYAEERLGISARRASRLVSLDRRLFFFPRIARAVRDGSIGTEAAWLLCKVATPGKTEDVWIDRARRRAVARLREEVRWVEREARMSGRSGKMMPPPPGRLPNALEEVSAAFGCPVGPTGEAGGGGVEPVGFSDTQPAETPTANAPTFAGPVEELTTGYAVDSPPAADAPTFAGLPGDNKLRAALDALSRRGQNEARVRVEFRLRESTVGMWNDARNRIAASTGDSYVSDAEVLRCLAVEFLATYLPLWFESVREGDPVAVRDRFRCQIPGCTVCGGSAHHLRFRSQLGPDEMWNLLFLCYLHHVPGVHRRCIRVSGRVPERVVFELGIRPDGTALETFVNEERLSKSTWAP